MDVQTASTNAILIYHNFRGMAQIIRYILFYLNTPFDEILLKQGETLQSLSIIKQKKLTDGVQLPCLIDGEFIIQDTYAIIRHLITKAKRQDLLGQNLEQRSLIRQIYYNFILKKKKQMVLFFKFGQKVAGNPEKKEEIRKYAMKNSHQISQSVIQLTKLKLKYPHQKYIFSHITILDFLFFEECFYQTNLFGNLEEANCSLFQTINSIFNTEFSSYKQKSSLYLKVMKEYKKAFENEFFYTKNKQKLESYSVLCPYIRPATKQAFKNVWLGSNSFIQ